MLFSDKSFCLFEINAWPLPPKIFTIFTQKIKPVEEWKVTGVNCQYWAGILGYLHGGLMFLYNFKTNGIIFPDKSFCFFEINGGPLPPKNFTILTQKIKPVED